MNSYDHFQIFQERLREAFAALGIRSARFCDKTGIARSTMTQLLKGDTARMPRLDTIVLLAQELNVTADWLLGLTNEKGKISEIVASTFDVAETERIIVDNHPMYRWVSQEPPDIKLRQHSHNIPDHMVTIDVLEYQYEDRYKQGNLSSESARSFCESFREKAARVPVDICVPMQGLLSFAAGQDVWSSLGKPQRREQLLFAADCLDSRYPTHQMYIYSSFRNRPPTFILYGHQQASLWIGSYHLIFYIRSQIETFHRQFDDHVKSAIIYPHQAADHLRGLARDI